MKEKQKKQEKRDKAKGRKKMWLNIFAYGSVFLLGLSLLFLYNVVESKNVMVIELDELCKKYVNEDYDEMYDFTTGITFYDFSGKKIQEKYVLEFCEVKSE